MNSFENIMERAAELQSLGQAYALVTVIKTIAPTSANVGDKALGDNRRRKQSRGAR